MKIMKWLIFLVFHYLALYFTFLESHSEKKLRQYLFANYSSFTRPLKNESDCIYVNFSMKLIRLYTVEERTEKLASQAYYAVSWQNEFLKWNPEHWGGIRNIEVDPKRVWIPDIILKNNADRNPVTIQKGTDRVWINYRGVSSWYPKVMMISSFKADVTDFPFDNQKFIFHFGSWSLGDKKLRILRSSKSMLDRYYLKNAEWELLRMSNEVVQTPYDSDRYSEILFIYQYTRKPTYSVVTSIVPSVMLMVIALTSFILPPYNGERIKVLITALLAFTVFQVQINGSLPRNSDSIPIIQIFYMVTMGECILCFLATCVLARMFEKNKHSNIPFHVPTWIRRYLFQISDPHSNNSHHSNNSYKKQNKSHSNSHNGHVHNGSITCKNHVTNSASKYEMFPMEQMGSTHAQNGSAKSSTNGHMMVDNIARGSFSSSRHEDLLRDDTADDDVENGGGGGGGGGGGYANEMTWYTFIDHVDRVCFRAFCILFLSTTVGILLPAYFRKYWSTLSHVEYHGHMEPLS